MSTSAKSTKSTVIPGLAYRDAPKAIEWLCENFGFQKHLVVPGERGSIMHAELTFGNGMIMLGSARGDQDFTMKQPDEIGGAETQAPYLIVSDADAVYKKSKAAGATIVRDIVDNPYGGRGFSCRDLEGHLWHIGTYDPWQAPNRNP